MHFHTLYGLYNPSNQCRVPSSLRSRSMAGYQLKNPIFSEESDLKPLCHSIKARTLIISVLSATLFYLIIKTSKNQPFLLSRLPQ